MTIVVTAALVAGTVPFARADEPYEQFDRGITLVSNDKLDLDIWGRGQWIGVGEVVPETAHGADHERVYEFLQEARMGFNGKYDDLFNYQIELAYGGENQNTLQSEAGGYDLMDFVADVPVKPLGDNAIVKVGQFRVPYGREALTDEGYMDFADKSIAYLATNHGRDFGLAFLDTSANGKWTGTIGTFPDGGRDIAPRYLPEELGVPEIVFRAGYNDGVDKDIYHVLGTDRNLNRDTKAFFVNGLFETDTRIGHSTALLSHSVDGNLLDDTSYNPYINRSNSNAAGALCSAQTCSRGMLWNVGGDAVYRHPMGNGQAVEVSGQADWGGYQNPFGVLHIASALGQGDYQYGPWELSARYALLSMDSKAGYLTTTAPTNPSSFSAVPGDPGVSDVNPGMGKPIHEITPSITYHFKGGNAMKIVWDLPIYLDCPVYIDHTDGTYVFADSTGLNEDSVFQTAGNTAYRRAVYEGRMMFQFQF
jgi:hypothetical protein